MNELKKNARFGFGITNVSLAFALVFGVYRGLPTRWWVVDGPTALGATLMAASGVLLLLDNPRARDVTRAAAGVVLALGLALVLALAATAAWLQGVYGPVGKGGASIFGLVCLLVMPYLVVLPAVELGWVGPREKTKDDPKPKAKAPEKAEEKAEKKAEEKAEE